MTSRALLAPARLAGRPVLRSQSDERLVDLVRSGSEPAFETIVTRYRGQLLRYCKRILPQQRAEDAVQQAFLSAFAAMRRSDARLDLRPWLYRIVHNAALNVLRDRGLQHLELNDRLDGVERPDEALERRQGLRELVAAVSALPERQRDAILLRELEGRSYQEIAAELGVSGGAVRQLLNRARATLRAGVTAVTPLPLMIRLWSSGADPTADRIGQLAGAGGAGALLTKVAATALLTGAVAGGIATVPHHRGHRRAVSDPPRAVATHDRREAGTSNTTKAADPAPAARHGDTGEASGGGSDDHSGSGSGSRDREEGGHSGPGGGSGDDGHSGSPAPTTSPAPTGSGGPGSGEPSSTGGAMTQPTSGDGVSGESATSTTTTADGSSGRD